MTVSTSTDSPLDATTAVWKSWAFEQFPKGLYLAMVVLGELSCLASIAGSSLILYLITIQESKWRGSIFERLMVGISLADFINTAGSILLQPFLVPAYTGLPYSGMGTDASCRVIGYIGFVGVIAIFYTSVLALYFVVTVRKDRIVPLRLSWYWEALIHGGLWIIGLGYATFSLAVDVIHPDTFLLACLAVPDDTKPGASLVVIIMGYSLVASVVVGFVCSGILLRRVIHLNRMANAMMQPPGDSVELSSVSSYQEGIYGPSNISHSDLGTPTATADHEEPETIDDPRSHGGAHSEEAFSMRRNHFIAQQGLFYMVGFCTLILAKVYPSFVSVASHPPRAFVTSSIFLAYLLLPLQGWVNCVIYMRPRFWIRKDRHPEWSWLRILLDILRGTPAPTSTARTAHITTETY